LLVPRGFGRRQGRSEGAALQNGPGCAWEARYCSIFRPRTSLNLGIERVYHPRMEKEGRAEKPNEISEDEY
jgi:hypothetical protein